MTMLLKVPTIDCWVSPDEIAWTQALESLDASLTGEAVPPRMVVRLKGGQALIAPADTWESAKELARRFAEIVNEATG